MSVCALGQVVAELILPLCGTFYEQTQVIWPWVRSQPIKGNYATFYSGLLCARHAGCSSQMFQDATHQHLIHKYILFSRWRISTLLFLFWGPCVMHTRPDATFPNCPLRSLRATELNHHNEDEWEAGGEKGQEGGWLPRKPEHQLYNPSSLKYTSEKTQTDTNHLPGRCSDFI